MQQQWSCNEFRCNSSGLLGILESLKNWQSFQGVEIIFMFKKSDLLKHLAVMKVAVKEVAVEKCSLTDSEPYKLSAKFFSSHVTVVHRKFCNTTVSGQNGSGFDRNCRKV